MKCLLNVFFVLISIFLSVQYVSADNKNTEVNIQESIDIAVSARVKIDGKIENGIHTFKLYCGLGSCELEITSINECVLDQSGNSSFTPFYHTYSTWSKSLDIAKITGNTYKLMIRQTDHGAADAYINVTLVHGAGDRALSFTDVTAFEAKGFINYKPGAKPWSTVEYVPITSSENFVVVDCPLKVYGLSNGKRCNGKRCLTD